MQNLDPRILHALFDLAQADIHATPEQLARWLGVPSMELAPAVDRLARRGLIDRERLRLTLMGLAQAVRAGARVRPQTAAA